MKDIKPASPSHSLSILNEHMQTDILRFLQATLASRLNDTEKYSSPLAALIASLEETIEQYKSPAAISLLANPFYQNPLFPFDPNQAYNSDMELMAFQLSKLRAIAKEIAASS